MKNPLDDLLAIALQERRERLKHTKTPKRIAAENSLPPELRDTFNALVSEYMESCARHLSDSSARAHYRILADLVLGGWCKGAA